jgi:hypothetical protein
MFAGEAPSMRITTGVHARTLGSRQSLRNYSINTRGGGQFFAPLRLKTPREKSACSSAREALAHVSWRLESSSTPGCFTLGLWHGVPRLTSVRSFSLRIKTGSSRRAYGGSKSSSGEGSSGDDQGSFTFSTSSSRNRTASLTGASRVPEKITIWLSVSVSPESMSCPHSTAPRSFRNQGMKAAQRMFPVSACDRYRGLPRRCPSAFISSESSGQDSCPLSTKADKKIVLSHTETTSSTSCASPSPPQWSYFNTERTNIRTGLLFRAESNDKTKKSGKVALKPLLIFFFECSQSFLV